MFFDSWMGLGRVTLVGALAYAALIVLLRISGKRTLTKLHAFDFVITVALGSTLATVLLNKSVTLAEGIAAMALLVFLQFTCNRGLSIAEAVPRRRRCGLGCIAHSAVREGVGQWSGRVLDAEPPARGVDHSRGLLEEMGELSSNWLSCQAR